MISTCAYYTSLFYSGAVAGKVQKVPVSGTATVSGFRCASFLPECTVVFSFREEADGVHNSLAIVENIVEFRPAACRDAAQAGLLAWLVKKLKVKLVKNSVVKAWP